MSSTTPAPGDAQHRSRLGYRGEIGRAMTGLDQGWHIGTQLLAGILLLGGLGWWVDQALGTGPWLFAIGSLAGYGVSLYAVWLRAVAAPATPAADPDGSGVDDR